MTERNIQKVFLGIRSNRVFEAVVVSIIIFSALVVGAKTYAIPVQLIGWINWIDKLITAFFLAEILIRFFGEERKIDFFKSGWNIFDTLIVLVSTIPIQEGDMAIVARLIRVFRVLRMVSLVPELRVLLNSLMRAMPQLGYVLLLMFIIYYIYAAIGSTLFGSINEQLWGDISISMLTLFRVMTFEDWTDVMYETMSVYGWSWLYFITFIFFTTFAFLNMIIGIVVNVLEQETSKAKEAELVKSAEKLENSLERSVAELTEQVAQLTAQLNQQRLHKSRDVGMI